MRSNDSINPLDKPSQDTQSFGYISPAVFKLMLDVIPALGQTLNWAPLSEVFLAHVLRNLPEGHGEFAIRHADFARVLFRDLTEAAGRRRISRAVSSLKKDQALSGFQAVWIESGDRVPSGDGFDYSPTTYRLKEFFDFFASVQQKSVEYDLFAMALRKSRIELLLIVREVCKDRGFQAVPTRARQQAKKSATPSEACGASEPRKGKVTKDDVDARINLLFDQLFECGQDWMSCGLVLPDLVRGLHRQLDMMEVRLREAVARSNKPRLKLIGG